jgi:hypothetical protein
MTHEQIVAAISRIVSLFDGGKAITPQSIVDALSGDAGKPLSDTCWDLIDVLQDADVSEWPDETLDYYGLVRLPKDADGEVIHVGDKVESDTREDGTVVGVEYRDGDRVRIAVRPHNWNAPTWCDPAEYRHYNKPAIEGVLREFVNEWMEAESEGDVFAKYADKLREVIADDE